MNKSRQWLLGMMVFTLALSVPSVSPHQFSAYAEYEEEEREIEEFGGEKLIGGVEREGELEED
jgi:hypothetical protein